MPKSDPTKPQTGTVCFPAQFSQAALLLAAGWLAVCTLPGTVYGQLQGAWTMAPTVQASGIYLQMPLARPVSRKSQLGLSIDTRWANNYGYRAMEVKVTSPKPATSDTLLTIRLKMTGWGWQSGEMTVEQDFELPMGQTSATATILCPLYRMEQQYMWWDVWVDGAHDGDLSMKKDDALNRTSGAITPSGISGVSCLIVGPKSRQRTLVSPSTQEFEAFSLAPADFPRHWLGYTCFDVVSISFTELRFLAQTNPDALAAIRRWVRTGGQLWVSELSPKFEELPGVSKLFELDETIVDASGDTTDEEAAGDDDSLAQAGWRAVRFRGGNPEGQVVTFMNLNSNEVQVARDPDTIARLQNDPNYVTTARQLDPDEVRPGRRWSGDSSRWFIEQHMGLGSVRAFRNVKETEQDSPRRRRGRVDNPQAEAALEAAAAMGADPAALVAAAEPAELPRALALALRSARRWDARHGMTPDDSNLDFAKLLVPGVGLAPVTEFRVLITLFVLLIGPGNYWLLKRFRRLHLLVLTVPVAAFLTTTALFAYAVLSDGFGTTVRVHSFTTIDQRTGEAACWSRLSYYSGLAPGHGLTMPSDVAVYPIIPGWNESAVDANVGTARELQWEPNQARLTRGWLRSRTPTQYLTIRSRKAPRKLELLSANGKMRANNDLGTRIQFVVAIDDEGGLFAGENVAARAKMNLQPIARSDAIRRLRKLITDNEPQAPPALAAGESEFQVLQQRQMRRTYRRYGLNYSQERLGTNLVNDAMSQLAGLDGQPALQLPPRSYVAITDTGPEVELGMSGAKEELSFHVLMGRW